MKTKPTSFKAGRIEYSIESREVYGKIAYFPMLVRGCKIKGPFCLAPGVGAHIAGVPSYDAALKIIQQDAKGELRELSPAQQAAAALGSMRSDKKTQAAKTNGKLGGRPKTTWHKAPAKGCTNPKSELFRYTVVRLSDMAERFTDRKPRPSLNFMTWDNRENREV